MLIRRNFVALQCVMLLSNSLWSKNAIRNQYTPMNPYVLFYTNNMTNDTMIVIGASNRNIILLNIVNTSFISTFYNWRMFEWGISFLAFWDRCNDFYIKLFAMLLSTLIANSWNILLVCYPNIVRKICTPTKFLIKIDAWIT